VDSFIQNRKIVTILITGGSGLIGSELTHILAQKNYTVRHLSRNPKPHPIAQVFGWNPQKNEIDQVAFDHVDAVIHLAGAGVADARWTPKRKKILTESRIRSTQFLGELIRQMPSKPRLFLAASGIGYYGSDTGGTWVSETDDPGNDFLAQLCMEWERAAEDLQTTSMRVVKLRIGLVLSKHGGALAKMVPPVKYFVGSSLGSGHQYISWIHVMDLCNMVLFLLENESVFGTYNAVSHHPETNVEFTRMIARVLRKPLWLPKVPKFVLKLVFGEMSGIILGGNRVSNQKFLDAGFEYKYDSLDKALRDILGKN